MYAVIFTATLQNADEKYYQLAKQLRELAREYGCSRVVSSCEDAHEITISYWQNTQQIQAWKNNELHQKAQQLAQQYYREYSVQITKIEREYSNTYSI